MKGDFVNFGTFFYLDGNILEKELEKKGISIKIVRPGTNIGISAGYYGLTNFYTIFIEEKNIEKAKEICDQFNIEPKDNIS